jgi:hypothetical protein
MYTEILARIKTKKKEVFYEHAATHLHDVLILYVCDPSTPHRLCIYIQLSNYCICDNMKILPIVNVLYEGSRCIQPKAFSLVDVKITHSKVITSVEICILRYSFLLRGCFKHLYTFKENTF